MLLIFENVWLWLGLAGISIVLDWIFPVRYFFVAALSAIMVAFLIYIKPGTSWYALLLLFISTFAILLALFAIFKRQKS